MLKQKKRKIHYTIMGIIGILFSWIGLGTYNPIAVLMLGILPMVSIIIFMITKHPAAGICYTALFLLNRTDMLAGKSTLLAIVIIVAFLIYFVYVNYLSIIDWKDKKKKQTEVYEE